jgi:hypothetical protein
MRSILAALFFGFVCCVAAEDLPPKLQKAINDGTVTKAFRDSLTDADVPESWATTKRPIKEGKDRSIEFKRGGKLLLKVSWFDPPPRGQERMFAATVYHRDESVVAIMRINNQIVVSPRHKNMDYKVVTSISDDGLLSIRITGPDDWIEVIEVDERNTHPINDLEYTRMKVTMIQLVQPIVDALLGPSDEKEDAEQ